LLREITIPTIFNDDGDEELQMDALGNLTYSLDNGSYSIKANLTDLLPHDSFLE
jgi:hypothetical protein